MENWKKKNICNLTFTDPIEDELLPRNFPLLTLMSLNKNKCFRNLPIAQGEPIQECEQAETVGGQPGPVPQREGSGRSLTAAAA